MKTIRKTKRSYLLAPFCWSLLMATTFFLAAGRLNISRGWLAFGLHFTGAISGTLLMARYAPELAKVRASAGEGTKKWDRGLLLLYFVIILLLIPLTAGLDVGRYRWSQLGNSAEVLGFALYVAFFIVFYWAMLSNKHFEGTARIQKDRQHTVVMHGPYRYVRHPGYLAILFASFSDAFLIGSLIALLPSLIAATIIVVRTYLEDRMLYQELDGYAAYAKKTKYRLIPAVW